MNQELSTIFQTQFIQPAQLEVFAAGRVNLIGEHTDYNDGLVLPTAIPQKATLQLAKQSAGKVSLYSLQMHQKREYVLGSELSSQGWIDYAQAVTHLLQLEGYQIAGFQGVISSDVPLGSGLSSSAAFLGAISSSAARWSGLGARMRGSKSLVSPFPRSGTWLKQAKSA